MTGIIPLLVIWLYIAGIAAIIYAVHRENKKKYEETEYFEQTHTPYSVMRHDRGKAGEFHVYECLRSIDGYKRFLFNTYIPKTNGSTTEVDIIMLHESGVYVIESKNYGGEIYGSESSQRWTQILPAGRWRTRKNTFFNPIIQNSGHVKWLQKYTGRKNGRDFYSVVIFGNQSNLHITDSGKDCCVLNCYEAAPIIRKHYEIAGNRLAKKEIDALYEKLYPLTQVDEEGKIAHVEDVQTRASVHCKEENIMQGRRCPCCGNKLVVRTATRGCREGKRFLGCSDYPNCNFIKNID